MNCPHSIVKYAEITLLTGPMGAGKSTILQKVKGRYDLVVGSDVGGVVDGRWEQVTDGEKFKRRQQKAILILNANKEGKSVLVEGGRVAKLPGVLSKSNKAVLYTPPYITRLMHIYKRSKARKSSFIEDFIHSLKVNNKYMQIQKIKDQVGEDNFHRVFSGRQAMGVL